ncbi:MAG TPA: oligosaccharide flippase family protein [Anaerolineales bacterium]
MLPFSIRPDSARANLVWATAIQVIEKLAGYAVLAVLTRTLISADMGRMFLAATVSGIAATVISFGSENHLIRAVAAEPQRALTSLGEVLSLRLQNLLLVYAVINLAFRFLQPDLSPVLLLVTAYDFVEELWYAFSAFFTGQKKLRYRLIIGAGLKILTVLAVALVAYETHSLQHVLLTYLVLDAALVVVTYLIVRRDFGPMPLAFNWSRSLALMRVSLPFFIYNILIIVHLRLDTLMVGFMLGVVQVAYYDLGMKLLEVARFIVRPLHQVFYPIFAELAVRHRWKVLRRRATQLLAGAFVLGLIAAVGMQLLGDVVIVLLFGSEYAASAAPTKVLFLSLPLIFLHFLLTTLANALHLEKQSAWLLALSTALNLGLNLAVLPRYGILGAAWTTLASQAVLTAGLLWVAGSRLKNLKRA